MIKNNMSGKIPDWTSTLLWAYLDQSKATEADAVRVALKSCMPDIQAVLAQGGTAPLDFTLHDAEHGFRVAQQMAEIIPDDALGRLTAYELALLLLSAYLHDIGMTPARRKVTAHYKYLLTGEGEHLTREEIDAFQKWIDDEGRDVEPPLAKGAPTGEVLRLAEEITAYYCRHQHNDWGAEWVRENLQKYSLGSYANWLEDLVELCRSHHYGYDELVKKKFDPRTVGAQAAVVHLRYLACVLRVADVLEVDPERTPEVIFRHRDVGEGSVLYWYKDHQLSVLIQQEEENIVISARPSRAYIHKAIDVTVDQMDHELRVCRAIADETHFGKHLTLELPHRWVLPRSVHRDITPAEGTYEYINGAFRPDTQKLLELLSGVELYGTPLAAVRELLQNAFDAVREQVAYQRLETSNPADPQLEQTLGGLNRVALRLELNEEGAWLVCTDTGVGMSKSIINDHLLVSGLARRHDVLDLERRARQAGFTLGRTGQFGIGVLSYFMLADRIVIHTKRSQESRSSESNGWRFETRGVGSFGELRQDNSLTKGTEIRLRLRPETIGPSPAEWYAGLRAYVKETLLHIPCQFSLSSRLPGCEPLDINPGWVLTQEDYTHQLLEYFGSETESLYGRPDTPLELLPTTARHQYEESAQQLRQTAEELESCLRWQEHAGSLPDDLGLFRIGLPYFELPGGNSLAFLRAREQEGEILLLGSGRGYSYIPKATPVFAWKGMRVDSLNSPREKEQLDIVRLLSEGDLRYMLLEVVFTSPEAAKVTVNRNEITASLKAQEALSWLAMRANAIRREFVNENVDSAYCTLNARLVEGARLPQDKLKWISVESSATGEVARWRDVNFPAANGRRLSLYKGRKLLWNGKQVEVVSRLKQIDNDVELDHLTWNSSDIAPERLLYVEGSEYGPELYWLWTCMPESNAKAIPIGATCEFPEKWRDVCGASLDEYSSYFDRKVLWNPENKIVSAIDGEGWEWANSVFDDTLDPIRIKDELFKSGSRLAAWIIRCINAGNKDLWEGLAERDATFLPRVWESLGLGASRRGVKASGEVLFLQRQMAYLSVLVLTPGGWQELSHHSKFSTYLPDPGPEWQLVPEDEGAERAGRGQRKSGARRGASEGGGTSSKRSKAKSVPAAKARAGGGRGAKKGGVKKKR